MKILLVEDNPIDRRFVLQSLRQVTNFSFQLHECSSIEEARASLLQSTFDVILLDLCLPDSEGVETCQQMIAVTPSIPVVVMTATDDQALATEALRCGAQDYLVKGLFPGAAIARVLQYAIDRHQFRTQLSRKDQDFREVMSHLPAIVWTTDADIRITGAFGAGLKPLGLTASELVGKLVSEFLPAQLPDDPLLTAHHNALANQPTAFEGKWLQHDFEVQVSPVCLEDHRVAGTIGVALDVTERRNFDRAISFARLIQKSLLPASQPSVPGFDIYGASFPAKETSGDWFDYLQFPDGSWGLTVGDVSGKGFGPAILSATIAAYFEALAEWRCDLDHILNSVNRMVCQRSLEGQFAVLSLVRLAAHKPEMHFAGAGDGILIVNRNGELKRSIGASGFPVGLVPSIPYDPPTVEPLDEGDIVLLLTDGFRESLSPHNELFGNDRVVATVAQHVDGSAQEIFNALRQAASAFAGNTQQADDMTGIVIKWNAAS